MVCDSRQAVVVEPLPSEVVEQRLTFLLFHVANRGIMPLKATPLFDYYVSIVMVFGILREVYRSYVK